MTPLSFLYAVEISRAFQRIVWFRCPGSKHPRARKFALENSKRAQEKNQARLFSVAFLSYLERAVWMNPRRWSTASCWASFVVSALRLQSAIVTWQALHLTGWNGAWSESLQFWDSERQSPAPDCGLQHGWELSQGTIGGCLIWQGGCSSRVDPAGRATSFGCASDGKESFRRFPHALWGGCHFCKAGHPRGLGGREVGPHDRGPSQVASMAFLQKSSTDHDDAFWNQDTYHQTSGCLEESR